MTTKKQKKERTTSRYGDMHGWTASESPTCETVAELITALKRLPPTLPIHSERQKATWWNVGYPDECLGFEDPQDWD